MKTTKFWEFFLFELVFNKDEATKNINQPCRQNKYFLRVAVLLTPTFLMYDRQLVKARGAPGAKHLVGELEPPRGPVHQGYMSVSKVSDLRLLLLTILTKVLEQSCTNNQIKSYSLCTCNSSANIQIQNFKASFSLQRQRRREGGQLFQYFFKQKLNGIQANFSELNLMLYTKFNKVVSVIFSIVFKL